MIGSSTERVNTRSSHLQHLCRRASVWLLAPTLLIAGSALNARADNLNQKGDLFVRKALTAAKPTATTSVIVKLEGELTALQTKALQGLGAQIGKQLTIIRSVSLTLPTANLGKLADLPFVQRVSLDATVKKNDEFAVEHSGANVAMQRYSVSGYGVGVAVIDSGVAHARDLMSSSSWVRAGLVGGTDLVNDGKEDPCGHGTHVAGIIAGNGFSSMWPWCYRTFYGVAPGASVISVRVLDAQGSGNVSDVIDGIQWSMSNRSRYNIRVINLSLGHAVGESYKTDPLCQAVEAAWKNGIVVVCAAGNAGRSQDIADAKLDNEGYGTAYGSIQSPGNDPYVITVGAMKQSSAGTRQTDTVATYSSRGPSRLDFVLKPDIMAPGNRIISVERNGSYLDRTYSSTNEVKKSEYVVNGADVDSDRYFRLSGTSMAAPVVSGAVALMLDANPNLSPDTVKARLMVSADKWKTADGKTDPCTYGAGYLNIPNAIRSTVSARQSALSPTLGRDGQGHVYVKMDLAIWGTGGVWGSGVGDLRAVWGDLAIWGTNANLLNGDLAIWGTNVWSDLAIWGTASSQVDLTSTAIKGEN